MTDDNGQGGVSRRRLLAGAGAAGAGLAAASAGVLPGLRHATRLERHSGRHRLRIRRF
jgi:hypothetical protein